MASYVIPLSPIPNQTFNIILNEQRCEFTFITRGVDMYMNLTVNEENLINGQICLNNVDLIQYKHLNFKGKLYFVDTQGNLDPLYYGLNDRWLLIFEDDNV